MKISEDLHLSIRSIKRRLVESILLSLGIALGIGAAASGIALVTRSMADTRELLSSPQYREIQVSTRTDTSEMDIAAEPVETRTQQVILTSADLAARDESPDVINAYIANRTNIRIGAQDLTRMRQMLTQIQSGESPSSPGGGGGEAIMIAPMEGMAPPEDAEPVEGEAGAEGELSEERMNTMVNRLQEEIDRIAELEMEGPQPVLEEITGYDVSLEFFEMYEFYPAEGSLFTNEDMEKNNPVMVVGSELAKILYEDGIALNRQLLSQNSLFTIIGVLEPTGTNYDHYAYKPATIITAQQGGDIRRMGWNTTLRFAVEDPDRLDEARDQLQYWFDEKHGEGNIYITIPREEAETTRDRNTRLVTVILFLALSGLLIAGVNVSNILLARTMRRKREVGVLKALGASMQDIFRLFFLEAFVMGLFGAVLGAAISYLLSQVMENHMGFGAITTGMLALGVGLSWLLTVALTVFPALQASRVPAADAMRTE